MSHSEEKSTEERILDAAKIVFMKYGLYGARMQDIADMAHINKALLHYYFRNKEKIFDTIFEGALSKYFEQMDVFSDSSLPVKQRLLKYADNIIDFLEEYPQMSLFIIKEVSANPEMFKEKISAIRKTRGISLLRLLEEAMDRGEIKKMDPVIFMINLHSLCSYPFIAEPLFKHIIKANNKEIHHFTAQNLKKSVKQFIETNIHFT